MLYAQETTFDKDGVVTQTPVYETWASKPRQLQRAFRKDHGPVIDIVRDTMNGKQIGWVFGNYKDKWVECVLYVTSPVSSRMGFYHF